MKNVFTIHDVDSIFVDPPTWLPESQCFYRNIYIGSGNSRVEITLFPTGKKPGMITGNGINDKHGRDVQPQPKENTNADTGTPVAGQVE